MSHTPTVDGGSAPGSQRRRKSTKMLQPLTATDLDENTSTAKRTPQKDGSGANSNASNIRHETVMVDRRLDVVCVFEPTLFVRL